MASAAAVALLLAATGSGAAQQCCDPANATDCVSCGVAATSCCTGDGRLVPGDPHCYSNKTEECCHNNAHGTSQLCPQGTCCHGGARADERTFCCAAGKECCSGVGYFSMGTCCDPGEVCCKSSCGKAGTTCCSNGGEANGPPAFCAANESCCSNYLGNTCCKADEKCDDSDGKSPTCVPKGSLLPVPRLPNLGASGWPCCNASNYTGGCFNGGNPSCCCKQGPRPTCCNKECPGGCGNTCHMDSQGCCQTNVCDLCDSSC